MTRTMQFTIGTPAMCIDGVVGDVSRVVIDPVAETVTDLVIEPKHQHGVGRLVPIGLLDTTTAGETRLTCTLAEFDKLDLAQETHYLSPEDGYAGYTRGQAFLLPYYGFGGGALGSGMWGPNLGLGGGPDEYDAPITTDTVPVGDVAVYRGDRVHATDGEIGRVQGLVIDPHSHHVTHVLLQEGHLFGRKDVAIPITAVTTVATGIQVKLTKQQVKDLPSVDKTTPAKAP
ncbi:PRC-barrel domain-containing protein [Micromonosporaceae bacterium Da 78-11]